MRVCGGSGGSGSFVSVGWCWGAAETAHTKTQHTHRLVRTHKNTLAHARHTPRTHARRAKEKNGRGQRTECRLRRRCRRQRSEGRDDSTHARQTKATTTITTVTVLLLHHHSSRLGISENTKSRNRRRRFVCGVGCVGFVRGIRAFNASVGRAGSRRRHRAHTRSHETRDTNTLTQTNRTNDFAHKTRRQRTQPDSRLMTRLTQYLANCCANGCGKCICPDRKIALSLSVFLFLVWSRVSLSLASHCERERLLAMRAFERARVFHDRSEAKGDHCKRFSYRTARVFTFRSRFPARHEDKRERVTTTRTCTHTSRQT